MIGRFLSFAFEATLVSATFAGATRVAGTIEHEQLRGVVAAYVGVGDWVIDAAASQIKKNPDYFKKA
ncbi:hypothetical protein HK100_010359 [Physocladia obscura]|uniref:Uncharacterized protein n=1 Tax=Physocladia obscura TaxID=109957 RepID=A0AAD5T320_9FUNG|nr:hypothetical protein HK100_010359 [Physocladia obscura]